MLQCFSGSAPMILADMQSILTSAWSFLLLALGFSLVIFVHEMGHFLAAKWAGVRVERFAIGFGKELVGFTKGETRYSLNVLPLGGYVKMLGQEDFVVDKSGELKVKADPRSFTNKPIGKRMVIVSAGVVMNLIFAAIAFTIVAMAGRLVPPPIVGDAPEDTPAGRAGLLSGDVIEEINGTPVDNFDHLRTIITLSDPDQELVMKVRRDDKIVEPPIKILPEFVENQQIRQIGVGQAQNRRAWIPSLTPTQDESIPNVLHKNDELYKLFVNGKFEVAYKPSAYFRAAVAAQGEPIRAIVKRPVNPDKITDDQLIAFDSEIESKEVEIALQATWIPLAYDTTSEGTASLLGLVPRLTVWVPEPGKSFDKVGVQRGDIIAKIDGLQFPKHAELKKVIESNPDTPVTLEICRRSVENQGLSARAVDFCVLHREDIIAQAASDAKQADELLKKFAQSDGLSEEDFSAINKKTAEFKTVDAWQQWLDRVDVHQIKDLTPKRPFALFQTLPPTIDAQLVLFDEPQLIVADIVEKFGDRSTPAAQAGIPRGAVIVAVNDKPVRQWYQLSQAFRDNAGKTVKIAYRLGAQMSIAQMAIPQAVQTTLGISPQDRIIKIDGKDEFHLKNAKGNEVAIALPDWRAVQGLLKAAEGRSVNVEYVAANGEKKSGSYAVTSNNVDPWVDRSQYQTIVVCYPLLERHPIHNPIAAFASGTKQAYRATVSTIQGLRHMLITRQVGISKVSGPVGIIRFGSQVADSGMLNLLWFLGLISANLAVINFLPMPIVDGGLMLFLLLEKIRGEPVSIKTQVATQLIGIALIATVFILVTYNDIKNWILGA